MAIVISGPSFAISYSTSQSRIFDTLTNNVRSIGSPNWRFSAIKPLNSNTIPLFWGNHKAFSRDIEYPQNSYPPVAVATLFNKGKIVALGHEGLLVEPNGNPVFINNCLKWLSTGKINKKVILYTHISNWFKKDKLAKQIIGFMINDGIQIAECSEIITADRLKTCDVLIIARPTQNITDDEVDAIISFISSGGGLLTAGLGWYWSANNSIGDFPLNKLGKHFGFEYSKYPIYKTYETNEKYIQAYSVYDASPLPDRKPVNIRRFLSSKDPDKDIISSVNKNKWNNHYVLEGKHVITSMPYDFYKDLSQPIKFINQLDTIYALHQKLADGLVPFDGDKILVLNVDNLNFHMCSGNPVLSRRDRIPYILGELSKSNYNNPGWGLTHELGHDFIIALNHICVLGGGDNESWANIFTLHAFDKLKIDQEHIKNQFWLDMAKEYNAAGKPDFNKIKTDQWLMLGLLHTIQKKYGWQTFYVFFGKCAEVIKNNKCPKTEQDKIGFLVKELSLSAHVNLYPYFKKWGFPVADDVNNQLKQLPDAKLF